MYIFSVFYHHTYSSFKLASLITTKLEEKIRQII